MVLLGSIDSWAHYNDPKWEHNFDHPSHEVTLPRIQESTLQATGFQSFAKETVGSIASAIG